jgi:hypothetical protein
MRVHRIITEHVYPPIPDRGYDWRATFDGYEPGDLMGYGRTRAEAIADLIAESGAEGGFEFAGDE